MNKRKKQHKPTQKQLNKAIKKPKFLIIAAKFSRLAAFTLTFVFFGWKLALIVFLFLLAIEIDNKLNKNLNI